MEHCIGTKKPRHLVQITHKDGHGRDDFHIHLHRKERKEKKKKNQEDNSNGHTQLSHFTNQTKPCSP